MDLSEFYRFEENELSPSSSSGDWTTSMQLDFVNTSPWNSFQNPTEQFARYRQRGAAEIGSRDCSYRGHTSHFKADPADFSRSFYYQFGNNSDCYQAYGGNYFPAFNSTNRGLTFGLDFNQRCLLNSAIVRRNERERNRVKTINQTFSRLRQHLPCSTARSKKLSKVQILRSAIQYINQLRKVLDVHSKKDNEEEEDTATVDEEDEQSCKEDDDANNKTSLFNSKQDGSVLKKVSNRTLHPGNKDSKMFRQVENAKDKILSKSSTTNIASADELSLMSSCSTSDELDQIPDVDNYWRQAALAVADQKLFPLQSCSNDLVMKNSSITDYSKRPTLL